MVLVGPALVQPGSAPSVWLAMPTMADVRSPVLMAHTWEMDSVEHATHLARPARLCHRTVYCAIQVIINQALPACELVPMALT